MTQTITSTASTAATAADHPTSAVFGVEEAPEPRTLVDILRKTIALNADAVALEGTQETLSYRKLEAVVEHHARRLAELGIGRGDRVGVRVPSGTTDLYVAILSTLVAGAAYVPVDWDEPEERASTVWQEAGVAAIFGAELEITQQDQIRPQGQLEDPQLGDDAWIIFTSGSTGKPKGVAITHRSAAALVDAETLIYLTDQPLAPGDRVMAGLSVGFDASCEEMWLAWRHGAALVAAPRETVRSGPDLGRWISEKNITAVSTVPTLASLWPAEALATVRLLIFGGEACPLELAAKLSMPGREVWNTYGPTEATVIGSAAQLTADPPVRIGRPVPGWALAVVNEDGEPVSWGQTGELVIGGVGLGRYLDSVKDAEKYAPLPALGWDRAYRTGDVVLAEQEGLIFGGRSDDQIKLGGRRMELGEVDDHLTRMPGVRAGAAAMHKTPAGSEVLVGYLVALDDAELDMDQIRSSLADQLPGGIAPTLIELDEMPMKTSGKVDRGSLPWPLPGSSDESGDMDPELAWLAELWVDQLGPLPITEDSDFFTLGGGSVAVARLVADLRVNYPTVEIAELYANPRLREMAQYVQSTGSDFGERDLPAPLPKAGGFFQVGVMTGMYLLNGLRYLTGALIVVWVLDVIFEAGWVLAPPALPLLLGWVVLFSLPGRVLWVAGFARLMTIGIRPGSYRRGGWTHLRIWAAERFLTFQKLELLLGSPMAPLMHRLMGSRIGRDTHLHHLPAVTGLVTIGEGATTEHESDLSGYWIDGSIVHVGSINIAAGARIGTRTLLSPGASVGAGAEILPGSHVIDRVPGAELWGGSPLRYLGPAQQSWPEKTPQEAATVPIWSKGREWLIYSAAVVGIGLLPLLAVAPGGLIILNQVLELQSYTEVFPVLALWVPVFVILTYALWLTLVIVLVRVASGYIAPGYFPHHSAVGFSTWLVQTLLQRTIMVAYPIYASLLTPVFMRLLGARVGRGTEISTAETIPHLSWLSDNTFVADHGLINHPRTMGGWTHLGTTYIGQSSFVGNSAIIGPDRDLPPNSLVAVLSATPYQAPDGSSWLGRRPDAIPRVPVEADASVTYNPPRRLKVARGIVESFRIVPAFIAAWLDLAIIYTLSLVYTAAETPAQGILNAAVWSAPVALGAGILSALVPVAAKWALMGRFVPDEKPLFSSFVWRNELADSFAEMLAVPSLIRMSLGTPIFNIWARLMGARIGRDVWVESWWLPEFDLISIGDRATINRGTVLQTHLFHDRVMGMDRVDIGTGATLGPNSFMLPGSALGDRTTVGSSSLVLRQEQVPADSQWAGNPIRHLGISENSPEPEPTGTASPHSRDDRLENTW